MTSQGSPSSAHDTKQDEKEGKRPEEVEMQREEAEEKERKTQEQEEGKEEEEEEEEEEEGEVEEEKRLWKHPWDPHIPYFGWFLPDCLRPFPFFEGWFARVSDFEQGISIATIMTTNYVTSETFVAVLFSFNSSHHQDSSTHGFEPHRTHLFCELSMDSHFRHIRSSPHASTTSHHESDGFKWHSANLGTIISRPHETIMDLNVQGFRFKLRMCNEVPWDGHDLRKGPEGWSEKIKYTPAHWHIRSLGSESTYELSHGQKRFHIKGSGLAHQEKNWGQAFPSGHVWLQAISPDNKCQIVGSVAYFNIGCGLTTPYFYSMGYRSPNVNLDLRSIDPGVIIRDVVTSAEEGKFSVRIIGPSHTLQIKCSAPPSSFSDLILFPVGKLSWKPACCQSYFARMEINVFKHKLWGRIGKSVLIETHVFEFGALEFGEELAMQKHFHED